MCLVCMLLSVLIRVVIGFCMVSGVEAEVVRVIGECRRALKFARFVSRFGKSYQSEEEMKERYEIFSQNLRFIRSHNKKRLPYTLSVNRMSYLLFLFLLFLSFPFSGLRFLSDCVIGFS